MKQFTPSWRIGLVLALLVVAVFVRTFDFHFVLWDDGLNVYNNPILDPPSLRGTLYCWEHLSLGDYHTYRPVVYTAYAVIAALTDSATARPKPDGGTTHHVPGAFHVANVFFHVLNVLLVFSILRLLVEDDLAAAAGALLFGIHPLQAEPVAWVTGLSDVLSATFALLSIRAYLMWARVVDIDSTGRGPARQLVVATGSFILALLAKPAAVTLPAVAWALERWGTRGPNQRRKRQPWLLWLWAAISVLALVITRRAEPTAVLQSPPLWLRPAIATDAMAFYLAKLLLPWHLGSDYGRNPRMVMQHGWLYWTWIGLLFPALAAWRGRARRPLLWAASIIFFVGLLPVCGLVPFRFQEYSTVADRYMYLPMLAPALAVAALMRGQRARWAWICCTLALLCYGIACSRQTGYWRDDFTLFERALVVNPHSSASMANLGIAYSTAGQPQQALAYYQMALAQDPSSVMTQYNMANLLRRMGRRSEAVESYAEVVRLKPADTDARMLWGVTLAEMGQFDAAKARLREAIATGPGYAMPYVQLALVCLHQGQHAAARQYLQQALKVDPNSGPAHYQVGLLLEKAGRDRDATDQFVDAVENDPGNAGAHFELGRLLQKSGKTDVAATELRQALQLRPDDPQTLALLATNLAQRGQLDAAIALWQRSLQLAPGNVEARYNLGGAYLIAGRRDLAAAQWREALRLRPGFRPAFQALAHLMGPGAPRQQGGVAR